ncbi:Fc.00g033960.m01.CDS01 [Cosmosporella sp. VM-42]
MAMNMPTSPLGITGFALVTGGASGIGRATCRLLVCEGSAGLCIADISAEEASSAAEEMLQIATNPSFKVITCKVDVVDDDSVGEMVATTVKAFGRVDYARGAIVNIASLSGLVGLRHSGAYTAAKHGVVGITQTAALDYPEVKSNAVVPGYIKTPLTSAPGEMQRNTLEKVNDWTPVKRFGLPEEVAESIVWLLGSRSNFVHGSCLTIDGGYFAH